MQSQARYRDKNRDARKVNPNANTEMYPGSTLTVYVQQPSTMYLSQQLQTQNSQYNLTQSTLKMIGITLLTLTSD